MVKKKQIILKVKKISKNAELPEYALESDVGFDLRANEEVTIGSMEHKAIKTGIAIEVPEGYVGLIRDRAGIITKMGVHTVAGTFDPAYRGEVSIILTNFGDEEVVIEEGMRIAQMIIIPVEKVKITEAKDLSETKRGKRGFGSTGVSDVIKELEELEEMSKED
jgi:dUTP pyrophosphatase